MTLVALVNYLHRLRPLQLERTPLYLRFVIDKAWSLDALDQPDDTPRENEIIIPAINLRQGTIHVDGVRNGKRYGEWHPTSDYEPVQCELTQEQLADYEQWKAWCLKQVGQKQESKPERKDES